MNLPFDDIPFSRYGSYFAVTKAPDGVFLCDVRGGSGAPTQIYKFEFNGPAEADMTESRLIFRLPGGSCNVALDADGAVHIACEGVCIRLVVMPAKYDGIITLGERLWEHQLYSKNVKIMLAGLGDVRVVSDWQVTASRDIVVFIDGINNRAECVFKSYKSFAEHRPTPDYEAAARSAQLEYDMWLGSSDGDFEQHAANYVLWGNFVRREGCLGYDALYMNKLAMRNIWSWDNCFSALALAERHPRKALEQLLLFFEHQDDSGVIPDCINDLRAVYISVKPPIYGWTVHKLREKNQCFKEQGITELLYRHISRLTEFWLTRRMSGGLPCYWHGNDSGWDNASVFHAGVPVNSPDLAAHLIYQMDALAGFALELDKSDEAARWRIRADEMFNAMMERLYTGSGFVTRRISDGAVDSEAHSLINLLPILIWKRLSPDTMDGLVSELRDFEADYGLATERPDSRYYKQGGYWLGPVWAPVMYMFIDVLQKAGYHETSQRLAAKYCKTPSIALAPENFDAFTGQGYDDSAYSWTAAVYLLLRDEYNVTL